jgi:hypothetical protein
MKKPELILLFFLLSQLVFSCSSNENKAKTATVDSASSVNDQGDNDTVTYRDCNENFFGGLQQFSDSPGINIKLKNGKSMNWKRFKEEELMSENVRYGLKSLDNDTIPELIILNNTGGAHCCDEIYIFQKTGDSFVQKARLFGGFICIDAASNIFTFSFNETLAYFYACYACAFQDSLSEFRTMREIELKYDNGRLYIISHNPETEKQLLKNFSILNNHGYEEIDQGLMDSGWRKEFAMNFAVWHYNHGKNWKETRLIFEKYYHFKDADKVWKEFYATLREAEKENSF